MPLRYLFAFLNASMLLFSFSLSAQDVFLPKDLTLTTLDSTPVLSTKLWNKSDKPTVLAFWLTTCAPCHAELGAYKSKFAEWQKEADFRLYAISIDFPQRFQKVKSMAREKQYPFEVYWDSARYFKDLLPGNLNGLPQVFLFDATGKLVWQHKRYLPGDEDELFAEIKKYAVSK